MKIAAAQIQSVKGDLNANIILHQRMITLAAANKINAIFFPELSLTGYEPALAKDLATTQDDERLDLFQNLSDTNTITIGIGLPVKTPTGIRIGMVIFQPGQARTTYAKQQLHSDELPYFEPGEKQLILTIGDIKIAPAICYESLLPDHAEHAFKMGAHLYLASVAKSQNGINKAFDHYPVLAKKYSAPVLMSNCTGHCDNFISAGQSSAWTRKGILAGSMENNTKGILVFDTVTETVRMTR